MAHETDLTPSMDAGRRPLNTRLVATIVQSVRNKTFFVVLVALTLPTLWSGMLADDYYIATRMLHPELLPTTDTAALWDTFTVSDGQEGTNRALMDRGIMPWWTSADFRFQMLRPLAEISHWFDYWAWPGSLMAMHAHHLLWVFAFFWVSHRFFAQFVARPEVAALATAVFLISANNAQTITWLASRNTVMALTFGIAAVMLHARAVKQRRLHWYALAVLSFALGLLSSEYGLTASAWLFAWALFLDRGPWLMRCARLLPYGVLGLAWAATYVAFHHGVSGSDYYVDPLASPLEYLGVLVRRVPTMVFNALFHVPAGVFGSSKIGYPGWIIAVGVSIAFIVSIRHRLKQPEVAFLLTGSVISMLPIAAGSAGPRTLGFVSLGLMPLVAGFVVRWALNGTGTGSGVGTGAGRVRAAFGWAVLILSLLSAAVVPTVSVIYRDHDVSNYRLPARQLLAADDHTDTVVLLNPNAVFYAMFYPLARAYEGLSVPTHFYPLADGKHPMTLTRDGEHSFVLAGEKAFLSDPAAYFMRHRAQPFNNVPIALGRIQIEVTLVLEDGRPGAIRVRLPDSSLRETEPAGGMTLLTCTNGQFQSLVLPPVGASVVLAPCEA